MLSRMKTDQSDELQEYIEEYGVYTASGLPRMAGKVLGWLMVCTPPNQTAEDIETALGASRGAVNTMTRLLMQVGYVEKIGIPGQRRAYFRVKEDVWTQIVLNELNQMRQLRDLAERGLRLLADTPPDNRQRRKVRPSPGAAPSDARSRVSQRLRLPAAAQALV